MKYLIVLLFCCTSLMSMQSKLINAYAVSIYDAQMIEENIQSKRTTKKDYEGICFTKIYVFGKVLHQGNITVKIGNTIGHKVEEQAIHKNRLIIGKSILFKHYGVSKGYLQVFLNGKLKDSKTFIR